MLPNLAKATEKTFVAAAAAGSTTLDTDVTLPEGCNTVEAIVNFGATVTVDAGNVPYIEVLEAASSDYSDAVVNTSLKVQIVAAMAGKQVKVELIRPTKPYYRLRLLRNGGTNSIQITDGVITAAVPRVLPETLPSSVYSVTQGISTGP